MNQNLLIVDDEREILSWLAELFKYEFDREVDVYTAESAMEAIKLLSKVRFDVVLTDVRMPGMDGITLFNHIKENWPRCKTVFLTGYRNFEDLYQITNHRDVKFILKSEEDDKIKDAVRESLDKSRQELEQEKRQKEQDKWLEEASYWMKRDLINQLCLGEKVEGLGEKMKKLNIPLSAQKEVLMFLIRIETNDSKNEDIWKLPPDEAVASLLNENAPLRLIFYVHVLENHQELLLVQPAQEAESDWSMVSVIARGAVEYTQEQFHNIYGSTFSTVVAAQPVKLSDMSNIFKSLKRSMLSFIGGAREVILLDESEEENDTGKFDYAEQVNALKRKLELRQKSDYFDILGKCMKLMTEKSSRHDTIALEIYYSISVLLLQFVNENHFQETIAFHVAMYKLTRADAHESWIEAAEYLTQVSKAVFLLLEEKEDKLANHALNRVVNYIDGHLDEELSLTALAEIGGFNSSYLSRLFKQVQNETIGDYILHKRLELAKKLLSDTDVKIQDISVKCGYISPHSFTRAFRNEVGISPTEYREIELDKRSQIM